MISMTESEITIQDVTENSLTLTVNDVASIRWQTTLVRGIENVVPIFGKPYRYEDIRAIWDQFASERKEDGTLLMNYGFPVFVTSLNLGPASCELNRG